MIGLTRYGRLRSIAERVEVGHCMGPTGYCLVSPEGN